MDVEVTQSRFVFLRAVPILQELDESALWVLAQSGEERTFEAEERVIVEGGECDAFYIVTRGQADVVKRDRAGMPNLVGRLGCGSYFGELGLLTNDPRSASVEVRSNGPLSTLAFDAQMFHEVIAQNVLGFKLQREQRHMQRSASLKRLRIRELAVLEGLSDADLDFIALHSQQRSYPTGTTIFEQGDVGDRFYILIGGHVKVERGGTLLAVLDPGDFFGESALLLDKPRSASITTLGTTTVWSITRAAFQKVVANYLLSSRSAHATVLERLPAGLWQQRDQ
jgi:cAMP-dependent protein kinase regulator